MKRLLLAPLLLLFSSIRAQESKPWTQFSAQAHGTTSYGYKDASGRVRIPAKFGGFTSARRFRHIMAVMESQSNRDYYLLKNGRRVGVDSVFVFDYQYDCESEGKIRFKDPRRNRVGFFDARGKAIIPAVYNYVTPFHNGLAVGLVGARQTCGNSLDTTHCEHPGWAGGRTVLLNARNEVLAELPALPRSGHVNWYSLKINNPAPDSAITVTWPARNGGRYTFTDYDKEFQRWLYDVFVPAVRAADAAQLRALCFTDLAVATRPFGGWPHFTPATFLAKYRPTLRARLSTLSRAAPGMTIFAGDLNPFIFESRDFQPFLTDCGEHFGEKYPIFELVLTYPARPANAPIDHQEHFEFIRTAGGYRLFSASL